MNLKKIVGSGIAFFLLLVIIANIPGIAFSTVSPNNFFTSFAYYITQSGGPIGTSLWVLLACILYATYEEGWKNKVLVTLKAFIGLSIVIGAFAALNEKFTKPILKSERPSHALMLEKLQATQQLDSLYALTKEERIAYFGKRINEQKNLFTNIDIQVLGHWIEEGGYSFPSGHSFNAFLLAMIFSFGLSQNRGSNLFRKQCYIPFIWAVGIAVSRVSLGAHHPADVIAGAAMGIGFGAILLYVDLTRHWITHKKESD